MPLGAARSTAQPKISKADVTVAPGCGVSTDSRPFDGVEPATTFTGPVENCVVEFSPSSATARMMYVPAGTKLVFQMYCPAASGRPDVINVGLPAPVW